MRPLGYLFRPLGFPFITQGNLFLFRPLGSWSDHAMDLQAYVMPVQASRITVESNQIKSNQMYLFWITKILQNMTNHANESQE